jgi:hypothetical protein
MKKLADDSTPDIAGLVRVGSTLRNPEEQASIRRVRCLPPNDPRCTGTTPCAGLLVDGTAITDEQLNSGRCDDPHCNASVCPGNGTSTHERGEAVDFCLGQLKESGGNYLALPKKKDGSLASSAVGKYQFLWNQNKDWISQVTGETTKTGFMHNPEAQEKAFKLKIKTSGSVIHTVTAGVDEGPVVAVKMCDINLKSLDITYKILHANSTKLWVEFLKEYLNIII